MVGADVEELRELARYFQQKAGQLQSIESNLAWRIHSAPWHGSDVSRFKQLWDRTYRSVLQNAAHDIRASAAALNRQADQQQEASAGAGGSSHSRISPLVCRSPEAILPDLESALGGDASAQSAWWNSLGRDEQRGLMQAYPSLILQLDCLSSAQREQALAAFNKDFAEHTMVASDSASFDVTAHAGWVRIGVDGEAELERMADGTYQVVLSGGASLGLGGKAPGVDGAVALTGDASATYRFDNLKDAQRFIDDLLTAAVPDNFVDGAELATNPPAYVIGKYAGVFANYSSHYLTTALTGGVEGNVEVSAGPYSAHVKAGATASYDTASKETTFAATYDMGAGASAGAEVDAHAQGGYQLTVDSSGAMKSLVIQSTVGASGGVGVDAEIAKVSSTVGSDASITTDIDLRNPANQQLAGQYLQAVSSGDFHRASEITAQLQQNSTVTLRSDAVSVDKVGFDAMVVEGDFEQRSDQATAIFVKPPNGTFQQVDLSGQHAGGGAGGGGGGGW